LRDVNFVSELRDALYVNWALPLDALPSPPEPLRPDTLRRGDSEIGFVTLVLFRQTGLRRTGFVWPRLSFPQCNFRLLVRDDELVASILYLRQLVPAWVVPFARAFGRQPASAAVFERSGGQAGPHSVEQHWAFAAGRRFELKAVPGASALEPLVPGGWNENVAYFRERPRGYVAANGDLRRLSAEQPPSDAVPMRVEVICADWLVERLPEVPADCWHATHSAFLIPSLQLSVVVETGLEARAAALPVSGRPAIT
jgi:hypothetical protein